MPAEDILEISLLYDIYGPLLTETQRSYIDMYYNDDMTLAEIASEAGVSRQCVSESLKRAKELMIGYEEKLRVVERFRERKEMAREVAKTLKTIEDSIKDDELKEKIHKLKTEVDNLGE